MRLTSKKSFLTIIRPRCQVWMLLPISSLVLERLQERSLFPTQGCFYLCQYDSLFDFSVCCLYFFSALSSCGFGRLVREGQFPPLYQQLAPVDSDTLSDIRQLMDILRPQCNVANHLGTIRFSNLENGRNDLKVANLTVSLAWWCWRRINVRILGYKPKWTGSHPRLIWNALCIMKWFYIVSIWRIALAKLSVILAFWTPCAIL